MKKIKFLPSITTVTMEKGKVGDWKSMVEEVDRFKLKEIGLFPTGLSGKEQRYRLYEALKKTSLEKILFVHLMTEMEPEELDYLVENFHTEVFNLHATANWPLIYDYSKYASRIFIENGKTVPTEEELQKFGGMCLDFAHWENMIRLGNEEYDSLMRQRLKKFPVGICHLSPMVDEPIPNPFVPQIIQYDTHLLDDIEQLE